MDNGPSGDKARLEEYSSGIEIEDLPTSSRPPAPPHRKEDADKREIFDAFARELESKARERERRQRELNLAKRNITVSEGEDHLQFPSGRAKQAAEYREFTTGDEFSKTDVEEALHAIEKSQNSFGPAASRSHSRRSSAPLVTRPELKRFPIVLSTETDIGELEYLKNGPGSPNDESSLFWSFKADDIEDDGEKEEILANVFQRFQEGLPHTTVDWDGAGGTDDEQEIVAEHSDVWKWWMKWKASRFRHRAHALMSDPTSSRLAWPVSIVVLACIVLSSITICLETLPELSSRKNQQIFRVIDFFSIAIFTFEYGIKLVTAPDIPAFAFNIFNIIDLIAILPFYVEWAVAAAGSLSSTRILRAIRLVRIFRVLKLGTKISKMQAVVQAVVESLDVLGMLIFLLMLALVLFSSLVYFAEKNEGNPFFNSIPESFWWCIVTLMTVGYGDAVPSTPQGKFVACLAMLSSIIIMALPISVIGASFTQQWAEYKQKAKIAERTTGVWGKFNLLIGCVDSYKEVLDDMIEGIRHSQTCLDHEIMSIRDEAQKAKQLYLDYITLQADKDWESAAIVELEGILGSMKDRLQMAQGLWRQLRQLMDIANSAQPAELHSKFDHMNLAYKKLKKWFEEGQHLYAEIQQIKEEVDNLPDVGSRSCSVGL